MRHIKHVIVCIVFLALFSCNSNNKVHKKLTEMSNKLNTSTPVMLDQYTRFDGTSVSKDNEFHYYYTILRTANPDSLMQSHQKELEEGIRSMLKTHPDLRIFVQNKVPLRYVYRDSTKKIIHTIHISPEFYSK